LVEVFTVPVSTVVQRKAQALAPHQAEYLNDRLAFIMTYGTPCPMVEEVLKGINRLDDFGPTLSISISI